MTGKTENQGVNMRRHNTQESRAEHHANRTKKKSSNRRKRITNDDITKLTNEVELIGNPRKK